MKSLPVGDQRALADTAAARPKGDRRWFLPQPGKGETGMAKNAAKRGRSKRGLAAWVGRAAGSLTVVTVESFIAG